MSLMRLWKLGTNGVWMPRHRASPFNEPFPGENKQFQERRNPMVLGAYEEHVLGPRRRAKERADKAEKGTG